MAVTAFATVEDIEAMWRSLTDDETTRAEQLLLVVSAELRGRASEIGKDLDALAENENFALVLKSVVVDIVLRALNTSTTAEPVTQTSESALGYTMSATYLTPGGGLYIKKSELARLGLRRQRYGVLDPYGITD